MYEQDIFIHNGITASLKFTFDIMKHWKYTLKHNGKYVQHNGVFQMCMKYTYTILRITGVSNVYKIYISTHNA